MSKETTVSRATPERSATMSKASHESEGAGADQGRIAQRAYELYEQRGRQEGLALKDWLNAERQLVGASGRS